MMRKPVTALLVLIREYAAAPVNGWEHNRHLRDVLLAKGHEVHYQEFPGGHDLVNWRASFPDAVI
jgi:hypothetical protein